MPKPPIPKPPMPCNFPWRVQSLHFRPTANAVPKALTFFTCLQASPICTFPSLAAMPTFRQPPIQALRINARCPPYSTHPVDLEQATRTKSHAAQVAAFEHHVDARVHSAFSRLLARCLGPTVASCLSLRTDHPHGLLFVCCRLWISYPPVLHDIVASRVTHCCPSRSN